MTKTIVHVWQNKHWGMGDLIRGTIYLYNYCKDRNMTFINDTSIHAVGQFLIQIPHEYSCSINLENQENIRWLEPCDFNSYLESSIEKEGVFITCNMGDPFIDDILSEECILFMKTVLTPTLEMANLVNKIKSTLPDPYDIIHVRLGDQYFNIDKYSPFTGNHNLTKIIQESPSSFLITDCYEFKQSVASMIHVLNFYPLHTGFLTTTPTYQNSLQYTLVEFFLLTAASSITTFSVYPWISGFVYWVSKIYNIRIFYQNKLISLQ